SRPPSCLPTVLLSLIPPPPRSPLFPYTTLFRSWSSPRRAPRSSTTIGVISPVATFSRIVTRTRTSRLHLELDLDDVAGLGHRQRSEEHTSELQSRFDLVCRLLLEKKKTKRPANY